MDDNLMDKNNEMEENAANNKRVRHSETDEENEENETDTKRMKDDETEEKSDINNYTNKQTSQNDADIIIHEKEMDQEGLIHKETIIENRSDDEGEIVDDDYETASADGIEKENRDEEGAKDPISIEGES